MQTQSLILIKTKKGAYTTISAKLGFIPIPASKIPMKVQNINFFNKETCEYYF